MLTRKKQIEELEAHIDHLQERVDNLRDDLRQLEDFFQHHVGDFIDERLRELEEYLDIEFVVEPERGKYIKKDNHHENKTRV